MKDLYFVIETLGFGGAERVTSIIASFFADENYNVTVFVYNKIEREYPLSDKVKVIYMNFTGGDKWLDQMEMARSIKRELLKNNGEKIVISLSCPSTNFCLAVTLFGKKGIHLILSERNDPARYPSKKLSRLLRNASYLLAEKIVFQTEGAKNYFGKTIQKKGNIIPNPIRENLPEPYLGERKKVIVNFCRLHTQKNIPLLIDSFVEFQKSYDYKLVIYGEGSLKESLLDYIKQKGATDYIKIENYRSDIHDVIKSMAMFVSSSDYEGISNSMLEALAIGLPCICTDCPPGGAKSVIDDGVNGLLVPVRNKEKMVFAMKKIAEDRELSTKLSANAVDVRNKYSNKEICKMWSKVIQEI